jgi:hypothetical protein
MLVSRYGDHPGVGAMDYRTRLTAAGYALHEELQLWMHAALDRALDARIAAVLTLAQLDAWIAAGQ